MRIWKKYSLLLSGIGVSYFGNWVYLIALNILVLDMAGSAAAVAGIYIVGPIARLLTNLWAGTIIDRVNKRNLMVLADILRGSLVLLVPFLDSLWTVYSILFVANIAGAFFGPSSTFYITKFVADTDRRRFNSIMSMMNSGSFLIGPAVAGVLIALVGTTWCIVLNAVTFFFCAVCIAKLPDVEDENLQKREPITVKMLVSDWHVVKGFIQQDRYFIKIYLLFQSALMIAFALDSQEVTFIKQNLVLSDQMYGLIVSIAGVGSLLGAAASAGLAKRFSLQMYVGVGMILTAVGYLLFYSAVDFWTATAAFLFLGFFMAFSNSGYDTFYQKNVPTTIMGRFGSLASMFQSLLQITFTFILGVIGEWFSLQMVAIGFASIAVFVALLLCRHVFSKRHRPYYAEGN
ncbi:MFS transporter [Sporosarcina sp. NPDC096371]|uniref:MFS transporter n=1 Tax=Sporosarcina sp. NPDC096371 TaxID=3364530 RepID=UPI00382EF08C